ncbi:MULTISPECIES: hypothetical protein [Enterococcus]|nr:MULTISPECIES: hypothetical protein [Enterococcus]NMP57429.1 hypothetical protein [Enterococcus mundtii]
MIKEWDEPDRVKNQRGMSADRENSHLANSVERMTTNKEVGLNIRKSKKKEVIK